MKKLIPQVATLDFPRILEVPFDKKVKKPATTIVMLHGIGNSAAGWEIVKDILPQNARLIAVDLLGFGESPKPKGVSYNVRIQARSVAATLLTLKLTTRVVLVGHSMGSLIAIEIAKRYPLLVKGLILCSPPIYRSHSELNVIRPSAEELLKKVYLLAAKDASVRPERYINLSKRVSKTVLASSAFNLTKETVDPYIAALHSSIIEQSTYEDVQELRMPIKIIYGTLDPFVINKNLKRLAKNNENITTKSIVASHEVTRAYLRPIQSAVADILKK